jgi:RDD family protein
MPFPVGDPRVSTVLRLGGSAHKPAGPPAADVTRLVSVADRRGLGGWLGGPGSAYGAIGGADVAGQGYADGRGLGLPLAGPGSLAGLKRRFVAIAIDWLACLLIGRLFSDSQWTPLLIFAAESVVLLPTLGSTFGMRVVGIGVRSLESGRPLLPLTALVRTLLLCVVVPAVIWDGQHRGLHDRAVKAVVVNLR